MTKGSNWSWGATRDIGSGPLLSLYTLLPAKESVYGVYCIACLIMRLYPYILRGLA